MTDGRNNSGFMSPDDAAEIAVAEEEGMQGPEKPENDPMRDILLALAQLEEHASDEPVAPTKQHGHS